MERWPDHGGVCAVSIALILDMAVANDPDRVAVVSDDARLTVGGLAVVASGGAGVIRHSGARHVAYVGTGGLVLPALLFACARAGVAMTPLNYRLSDGALRELIERLPEPLVVVDDAYRDVVEGAARHTLGSREFLGAAANADPVDMIVDPDDVAVVLFTSGTTSRPKAVELTHQNLTCYITRTVEFGAVAADDAALVCVPPYHIAGVSAGLSNLYAGRKLVYLTTFDPADWVQLVVSEGVTSVTVVPTMLARIIEVVERGRVQLPTLRTLAYGGAKVPLPLLRQALELLPDVGFVNAYGLTETSSTIAVLTPEDHRAAHGATDPARARRLGSVGRPVSGIDLQIRDPDGGVLSAGQTGELWVRGDQVSGRYTEIGSVLDADGWFPTRDFATVDEDGYLFIGGRADDTIIRGGENIAPAELEDVLVEHPAVRECAVVGADDAEWGQIIVAVVVPTDGILTDADELRDFVRTRLRGSRKPDRVVFRNALPCTLTGKVLRRQLVDELQPATQE